jgi:hypothetical protein
VQAMCRPERNVDRLILLNELTRLTTSHHGCACNHNPMLGAVMMHLQR